MYDRSAGPSDLQFSARLLERSEEPVLSQSLQSVCFLSFRNVVLLSHMQPFACNRMLLFWISARWAQCDAANPYMSWLIWNDTRVHSAPPPPKKGFGLTETKWILKNRSKMSWSIQCPKFELNSAAFPLWHYSTCPLSSASFCLLSSILGFWSYVTNCPFVCLPLLQDLCGGDRLLQPVLSNDFSWGPVLGQATRRFPLHHASWR